MSDLYDTCPKCNKHKKLKTRVECKLCALKQRQWAVNIHQTVECKQCQDKIPKGNNYCQACIERQMQQKDNKTLFNLGNKIRKFSSSRYEGIIILNSGIWLGTLLLSILSFF